MHLPGGGGINVGASVAAQSIYVPDDKMHHRIGDRIVLGERVFRYAHFVANTAAGLLCAPDQSLIGTNGLLADGSLTAAVAAGASSFSITHASALDSITKDMLSGGYVMLTDSTATTGMDQMYRIKSNTAVASLIVEITIYDTVQTAAVDLTTGVQVILSPFRQLRAAAVDTDDAVSGVPLVAFTTTNDYGWVQTWGPCMVAIATDTSVGGTDLVLTTAGKARICQTVADPRIGHGLTDITTANDTAIVNLQLYP